MEKSGENEAIKSPEAKTLEHISEAEAYFLKNVEPIWYAHLHALKKPDAVNMYQPSELLLNAVMEPEETIERNGHLLKTRAELKDVFIEYKDQLSKLPDDGPKTVLLRYVSNMLSLLEIDPSAESADADAIFKAIDVEWYELYKVKFALVSALEIVKFLPKAE